MGGWFIGKQWSGRLGGLDFGLCDAERVQPAAVEAAEDWAKALDGAVGVVVEAVVLHVGGDHDERVDAAEEERLVLARPGGGHGSWAEVVSHARGEAGVVASRAGAAVVAVADEPAFCHKDIFGYLWVGVLLLLESVRRAPSILWIGVGGGNLWGMGDDHQGVELEDG